MEASRTRPKSSDRPAWFATLLALAASSALTLAQTPSTPPQPSYEVATVKPWDGEGYAQPLRSYLLLAFGLRPSATSQLIAPPWVLNAKYVINAKPSEADQEAMKAMPPDQRAEQIRLMMQTLLADRFALKAHLETRILPLYHLVLADHGSKMKENAEPAGRRMSVGKRGHRSEVKATSINLRNLIAALVTDPEIDGHPVIDDTGLTSFYDFQLDWLPLSESGPATTQDTEGTSLFKALEEQLGLKLVAAKGPVQVVVIDHIEPPSEN